MFSLTEFRNDTDNLSRVYYAGVDAVFEPASDVSEEEAMC